MASFSSRPCRIGLMLGIFVAFLAVSAAQTQAAALPVSVSYDPLQFYYCGVLSDVGKLTATLSAGASRPPPSPTNDNTITATAVINEPYDDCATFHWLQIITIADPGSFTPLKYGGKPLNSTDEGNPLPIVDPPNPNYDGNPPDDDQPWYLTAAEEGGSTPGLGGTTVNDDTNTTLVMKDQPNYGGFTFDTFLVGVTGSDSFGIIAGFTWGYGSYGGADSLSLLGNDPGVGVGLTATVNQALQNSGFGAWTATDGFDEECCCVPLPATSWTAFSMLGGVAFFGLVRRQLTKVAPCMQFPTC